MNRFLIIVFIIVICVPSIDNNDGLSEHVQMFVSTPAGNKSDKRSQKNPGVKGKITLHELLRIGVAEGEDNQVFFRANDVQVDEEGNIYVLDAGNHRIQKYDNEGRYILTIGRKGQGPGEMMNPVSMQLDSQGNIIVFDGGLSRVSKFTPEGTFISSFGTNFLICDGISDSKNDVYIHGRYHENLIHKFDFNGKHLLSFMKEMTSGNSETEGIIKIFINTGKLAITSDDQIMLALPSPYTLFYFDSGGKLIRKAVANVSYNMLPYIMPDGFEIARFIITGLTSLPDVSICMVVIVEDFPKKVDANFKRQLESNPYKFLERYGSYIDVFDDQGNLFIHERIGNFLTGCRFDKSGNLYILESIPFSQLIKYQIHFPKQ